MSPLVLVLSPLAAAFSLNTLCLIFLQNQSLGGLVGEGGIMQGLFRSVVSL